jgi:O-methyltransferase involved in polyketide biosynthesis
MSSKHAVQLGQVEETLLVPLYGRAIESRGKHPILVDPKAAQMVEAIDWDFQRFGQRWRVLACALRSAMFDVPVAEFLRCHPEGTVVEIGCGLNTRFERLDNGRVHWFDLDLPDTIELRRRFFSETERRTMLAASVVDPAWIETVRRSPGPYFFVAETVFVYLEEAQVRAALGQIARSFPGAGIVFDTVSRKGIEGGNKDHANRKLAARFAWACGDPREIERWEIGLRVTESRSMVDVPDSLKPRLSLKTRIMFNVLRRLIPRITDSYRLNVFAVRP